MFSDEKLDTINKNGMKVLIADDHAIVRQGLRQLVLAIPGVSVVDESGGGQETLARLRKTAYDFMILDLSMPDIGGLDILQQLRNLDINCRVLVLSYHPQDQFAIRAFKLGASGYISKCSPVEELREAITKVASGKKYVAPDLAEKMLFGDGYDKNQMPHEYLSEREFQVMLMLAGGKSVGEIAELITLSDKTVSTYRARIMKKMGIKTNTECTLYAMRNGLIE